MKFPRLQHGLGAISDHFGVSVDLRRVLHGAGIVMAIQIAAATINYANQVLLVRWAGPAEFGAYVFAWSWTVPLAAAAAIGLAAAAIRFVPQYVSSNSSSLLHGYVRKSTTMSLGAGLSVTVVGLLVI